MNDTLTGTGQDIAQPRSSRGFWIVVCLSIVLLLPVGCFAVYSYMWARAFEPSFTRTRPFDSELWKNPQEVDEIWTSRSEMIGDLLNRYSFVGWTREEVEKLLGPGEEPPDWDDRCDFIYFMGAQRDFLPIDNEWLGFKLDEDGRVIVFGVMGD